jgi:peptidoglycan/xylan/chitin deacetylase (PgdA/CDA1 family)
MGGTEIPASRDAAGVTLTFDDGPDASWTPRVLRELAGAGVHATFFVIVPRARARPELVRAIVDGGHEVGLHCWEHVRHSRSSRAAIEADTDRALEALAELGVRPRRWRTPWGDTAPWTAALADARDLSLEGWTADTHDWRGDDAETMLAATVPQLGPSGTVLMHDGIGPGARRGDCLQTVRLIAPLCAEIGRRGWAVAAPLQAAAS